MFSRGDLARRSASAARSLLGERAALKAAARARTPLLPGVLVDGAVDRVADQLEVRESNRRTARDV